MIVGFTGFAQVGKDTAASFLVERGFTRIAFADILRQSLYNLNPVAFVDHWDDVEYRVRDLVDEVGWDRAKVEYPEIRNLLQRFGTEVGRELYGEQFWVERALGQIKWDTDESSLNRRGSISVGDYVITDVRFPNEEIAVHERGGRIFRIERPGTGAVNTHVSDTGIANLKVDGVIPNDGDLNAYRNAVLGAVGLD